MSQLRQPPSGQFRSSEASHRMAPNNGTMPNKMANESQGVSADYTPQIISYAVAFFMIFLALYYLITKKKVTIRPSNRKILILTLLGVGFCLRIVLATMISGHPFDLNTFQNWAMTAANNLSQFYQGHNAGDYPPLYIYILFLIGKIGSLSAMNPYYTLLLKLPSIVADSWSFHYPIEVSF